MPKSKLNPFDHLNREQRQAVNHGITGPGDTIAGPVLVAAGAGSGKTAVLACRVAHLIANGVEPSRICAITFTRKAADQIKTRVKATLAAMPADACGAGRVDLPWAGTFHAVGTKLIRSYASRLGLRPGFTTLDRADAVGLMGIVRSDCGFAKSAREFPKPETCLAIYSRAVNSQKQLTNVLKNDFPWCREHNAELRKLFAAYVEAKITQSVLDYDDLLLHWHDLLQDGKIAAEIGGKFDHILVDEFQEIGRAHV